MERKIEAGNRHRRRGPAGEEHHPEKWRRTTRALLRRLLLLQKVRERCLCLLSSKFHAAEKQRSEKGRKRWGA
eukprot:12908896-Prorocentrum_lima.AAC.1